MISLYTATVPAFRQTVDAVAGLLGKAETFATEKGVDLQSLVDARLAPDMLPFAYQVKSVASHSTGAINGVRAGVFSPDMSALPADFAAMRALLDQTAAALAALDPAEVDGFTGRDMAFVMGERRMEFTAEDFLLSFSMPNFYFHATTAYDILRAEGVPLGKRDYLGRPRVKG